MNKNSSGVVLGALAASVLILDLAGCPGPDPQAAAASPGNGGSSSAGMMTATASTGDSQTSATASSGSMGGGGMGSTSVSISSSGGSTSSSTGGSGGGGGCAFDMCAGNCVDLATDAQNCGACDRFCNPNHADVLSCQAGVCTSTCKPGFINLSMPPAPQDDDGCEAIARRVFISATAVAPVFGGYANADLNCQNWADNQGLGGMWKAWLSDSNSSPSLRFTALGAFVNMDGSLIAHNWAELTSGALSGNIKQNETGAAVVNAEVWTATTATGDADGSPYCLEWTSPAKDLSDTPVVGTSGSLDITWTSAYSQTCERIDSLYCFEQ